MKWHIKQKLSKKSTPERLKELTKILLKNRNLKLSQEKQFFNPTHPDKIPISKLKISQTQIDKAIHILQEAIKKQSQIVIYGDYDADGVTSTGIMWEYLHQKGAKVMPYIPDRFEDGYGMNPKTIKKLIQTYPKLKLIVTTDQGIVAHKAVDYCHQQDIAVIVTDHHQPDAQKNNADAVIHSTGTSGAGVAWFFCKEFEKQLHNKPNPHRLLELATIGTITDLIPLTGINRSIVYHGLKQLEETKRPGIQALYQIANINPTEIKTYHIGYLIGPRLNAMGRLQQALDSLRLLCTTDQYRAKQLALILHQTNQERQQLTEKNTLHALKQAQKQNQHNNILIVGDESYSEGIIGLIAGKLTEKFHKPAIVFSINSEIAKASARSIKSYNIINAIRESAENLLISGGGHAQAAGLNIKTDKIKEFSTKITKHANQNISTKDLEQTLNIDTEIKIQDINNELFQILKQFAPFGIGNPEPLFALRNVTLNSAKPVGKTQHHLQINISDHNISLKGIAFNQADHLKQLTIGQPVNLAFNLIENNWNQQHTIELKIKDIEISADKNSKPAHPRT